MVTAINTEEDYDLALDEVAKYFTNPPPIGSPDGDRFMDLVSLIEAYEQIHYPICQADALPPSKQC